MMANTAISTAVEVVSMARSGAFVEISELFAPQLRGLVSGAAIESAWTGEIARVGSVQSLGEPSAASPLAGVTSVRVPLVCENGELVIAVSVYESGELAGLQFVADEGADATPQDWSAASYADPTRFDELPVELGDGALAVPGTLSVPHGVGPYPAVVLLSGSGPTDRDSTIGANKPLKDVAWGLATAGIAVLRFDKVTHAHGAEVKMDPDFTLTDEYVPAALAGLELLRGRTDIDPSRIFVLGHSLGGTVAPLVASIDGHVAGLVILAGGAQPLQWAIVRQVAYIAALDPATAAAARPGIETLTRQAKLVDSSHLTASTQASDLPLGAPAPYWISVRDYDAVSVAASLGLPIFLLQGGRDYQATIADDLALWRAGLSDRPAVTSRVYDADNHFFFAGTGPSSPAEYGPGHHVDPEVVTDIIRWVGERSRNDA
jgi:uncharacterized protein